MAQQLSKKCRLVHQQAQTEIVDWQSSDTHSVVIPLQSTDLTMSTLLTTPVCRIRRHPDAWRDRQTVDMERLAADGTVDEFLTDQHQLNSHNNSNIKQPSLTG